MTLFKAIAVAGALALVTGASASAATMTYATTIEAQRGVVDPARDTASRADTNNALNAPDDLFYAMGFGGKAVLSFGTIFDRNASVWEVTFEPGLSGNHDEAVKVYVGSSYVAGSFDISSFTLVGTIKNKVAQAGETLSFSGGPFSYLALVDVSKTLFPKTSSFDGFDLNAVGVSPVPLPAGGLLLLTAIGGLAAARRRKAA